MDSSGSPAPEVGPRGPSSVPSEKGQGVPSQGKRCCKCGKVKSLQDFSKVTKHRDGHSYKCRICRSGTRRSETAQLASYRYHRTVRGRASQARSHAKRRASGHERIGNIVGWAVRSGKLPKPNRCEGCGRYVERQHLHGHHEDYSQPLAVLWLCHRCHSRRHSTCAGRATS